MSKDEIKLEYYIRLKTLNYIDLNEVLTQQLAKEMTDVHEQLLIKRIVVPKNEGTLHHKAKVLTKEELEANRSNAYKYLDL